MLVIGGDAVGSDLARGDGLDLKQYPTERRSYAEIMHGREVDTRNRFSKKQGGPATAIQANMKGDGRPEGWWAVGSTSVLWRKRGGGGFRQNKSLLLLCSK